MEAVSSSMCRIQIPVSDRLLLNPTMSKIKSVAYAGNQHNILFFYNIKVYTINQYIKITSDVLKNHGADLKTEHAKP